MLNNSDCYHDNYSHIRTFLKVGFGHEFSLRNLTLPVFGPHARRSTMKAYFPHCARYIFLPHSTKDIHITPPFDRRLPYYSPILHKTLILHSHFTQDLIYIILWKQIRVFLRNISTHHFLTQTEWIFCRWPITNPSVSHVVFTDYGKSEVKRCVCLLKKSFYNFYENQSTC